jgi:hypothetical protein
MKSPFKRHSRQSEYLEDLLRQVEELRGENARLRMDATRPASLQDARTRLAEIAGRYKTVANGAIHGTQQDRLDEAWHLIAEAQQVRSSLLSVLADLALACGQLSRKIEIDGGPMEIDRRITERRQPAAELAPTAQGRARVHDDVGPTFEIVGVVTYAKPGLDAVVPDVGEAATSTPRLPSSSGRINDRRSTSNGHKIESDRGNGNGNGHHKVDPEPVAESAQ